MSFIQGFSLPFQISKIKNQISTNVKYPIEIQLFPIQSGNLPISYKSGISYVASNKFPNESKYITKR